MTPKAILLVQAIENHTDVAFDYPLEGKLKQLKPNVFLSCDSLSDQVMAHYFKLVLEAEDEILIILDCRVTAAIGMGRTLLNTCIRKKGVTLLCLGDTSQAQPFLQLMKGQVFNDDEALLAYLSSN